MRLFLGLLALASGLHAQLPAISGASGGGGGGGGGTTVDATIIEQATQLAVASGSGTAYVGNATNNPASLVAGQVYLWKPDITNSGTTPTLKVASLAAITIVHKSDGSALAASELDTSAYCYSLYDGTHMLTWGCFKGATRLTLTCGTAPGTPSAGFATEYCNSIAKNLDVINDAGVVNHGVQTKAAVTHNFATAVDDDGTVHLAQPACADLSDAGAGCSGGGGGGSATSGADMPWGGLAASGTVTVSTTANHPLYLPINGFGAGRIITEVNVWITSADSGSTVGAAILDSTCTKVTNGGATAVVSTGTNQQMSLVFGTPPTLTGQGWLALSSDNSGGSTTVFLSTMDNQGQMGGMMNVGLGASTYLVFRGGNTATAGVLPATCGTRTNITAGTNAFPAVTIR